MFQGEIKRKCVPRSPQQPLLEVVDHLFFGNEMSGFVDQRHERVQFLRPVIQKIVRVFRPLEINDTSEAVHFRIDGLIDHQV